MIYACRKGQQKKVAGASIFADEVVAEGLAQIKDPHWRRTLELSLQMSKQAMYDKVGDLVRPVSQHNLALNMTNNACTRARLLRGAAVCKQALQATLNPKS